MSDHLFFWFGVAPFGLSRGALMTDLVTEAKFSFFCETLAVYNRMTSCVSV